MEFDELRTRFIEKMAGELAEKDGTSVTEAHIKEAALFIDNVRSIMVGDGPINPQ